MWVSSNIKVNPTAAGKPLTSKEVGKSLPIKNLQGSVSCHYGTLGTMREREIKGEVLDSDCPSRQSKARGQANRVSGFQSWVL